MSISEPSQRAIFAIDFNHWISVMHQNKTLALLILTQVVVSISAFLALMAVFEFPDVLRQSSALRLELFTNNQSIIVPSYYMLALTGLGQMIISVLFAQQLSKTNSIVTLGLLFGILTGLFQLIGFIRWPILVPYLASHSSSNPELIALIEGAFNHFIGMALGEHLGFLMQGLWTICIGVSLLNIDSIDRKISFAGITIGSLTCLFSYEPLGVPALSYLTNPVLSAWYIWLLYLSLILFKKSPYRLKFASPSFFLAVILFCSMVIPEYL